MVALERVSAMADDPFVPRSYYVTRRTSEAPDTVTLELVPAAAGAQFLPPVVAPGFKPGQFNMLYAFGVGEIAVSMSGDPADRGRFVHTVRAVGAVSNAIAALEPHAALGVRGPFGSSWPVEAARGRDVVFIAGGLGLAPLRPAIYHVLAHRELYRRVILLVGMRNPAEILYRSLLDQWRERWDVQVEVTVDRADSTWHGHVGVVPALLPRVELDVTHVTAMVCGPEIMMRLAANALSVSGVALENIYLSMERNMKCAVGLCGRCQFGPAFICKDGPVMSMSRIGALLAVPEV